MKIATYVKDLNRYYLGGYVTGGGPVVTINMIEEFSKRDDVEFFILTTEYYPENKIHNSQIVFVKPEELSSKLKELKIDCLISTQQKADSCLQVVTLHEQSPLYKIKQTSEFIRPIKRLLSLKKLKNVQKEIQNWQGNTKFMVVSKRMLADYKENYNLQNIFYNYPGCNQIYETYPNICKKETPIFGIVANSSLNKGGYFSLIVFTLFKFLGYKFKLKMILPKYKKDIFSKMLSVFLKKEVEFLPKQADMSKFYEDIDFLILPSLNEAFGLVVLESMSYAKPCLVSETTGAAEIITDDNGRVFKRNINGYLDGLKKITDLYNNYSEYEILSKNAFNDSKKYTWQNYVQNLLNNVM